MKKFLPIIIVFFSCTQKEKRSTDLPQTDAITISSTYTALHLQNGIWFYNEKLFTGRMNIFFSNGRIKQTTLYKKGKEEGQQLTYFDNERIAEQRFYSQGEKDSVHTGWWQNGNRRFEYHFKNGNYNGDFKEWYQTGEPLKYIHYVNGNDDWGKGWRQNGKLYMNFIVKNGRRYGLNNSNLCYVVKNGKGELVASLPDSNSK